MTPVPAVPGGGRRRAGGPGVGLDDVLDQQRKRDVIGPETNLALRTHSAGYVALLDGVVPTSVLDLGSGGGVPGLVLAVEHWTRSGVVLLDASQRRCTYLELCVAALDLVDRVSVHWGRAEEVGRTDLRGAHDLVVARSFGPPAATAEAAAPLLEVGGALVVSDPPGSAGDRWDARGLEALGLQVEATRVVEGSTFTRMRQVEACPEGFPRRAGVPERRPLF